MLEEKQRISPFAIGILSCLFYTIGIVVVGSIGINALDSSIWFILLVAVACFGISVFWARRTDYFQKEAVDIIYYSVALLGVVVFFSNEYPDRVEQAQNNRLRDLATSRDADQKALEEFELLVARSGRIRAAFNANTESVLQAIRAAEVAENVKLSEGAAFDCAEAQGFRGREPYLSPHDRDPVGRVIQEQREQRERDAAWVRCTTAIELLEKDRKAQAAIPIDLGTFLDAPERYSAIAASRIVVAGELVSIGDVRLAVTNMTDQGFVDGKRQALTSARDTSRGIYDQASEEVEKIIKAARINVAGIVGLVSFEVWPYVLILLLALKLARPRGQ